MKNGEEVQKMSKLRNIRYLLGSAVLFLFMSTAAFAADKLSVVEVHTGENDISIYVCGADEKEEISAQVGTTAADVSKVQKISNGNVEIRTLLMVDNSETIKKEQRERITELLQDIISQLIEGEKLCLATYGEEIQYLTEYTDNYSELKQAIRTLEYEEQEAYLMDVLYPVLTDICENSEEDVFYRILIISDGAEHKNSGIAKEVFYEYLKEHQIPINTIGCIGKNNEEQIGTMRAVSELSGGTSYILDEVENTLDISNDLLRDEEILQIRIVPAAESLDGGTKTVQLKIGELSLQTDVRMPQKEIAVEEVVQEEEPETEQEMETEPKTEPEAELEKNDDTILLLIGAAILTFLFICVIIVIVLIIKKSRKSKNQSKFERFGEDGENAESGSDSKTILFNGNSNQYKLILEKVTNPAISYSVLFSENVSVKIGRDKESCKICLDFDKYISSQHCEIGVFGGEVYLKDLGSSNGTFINGNRVDGQTGLIRGNILSIGEQQFFIYINRV